MPMRIMVHTKSQQEKLVDKDEDEDEAAASS